MRSSQSPVRRTGYFTLFKNRHPARNHVQFRRLPGVIISQYIRRPARVMLARGPPHRARITLNHSAPSLSLARFGVTHVGSVAKRCNRILKDYVVQSGSHLGLHGPDDLMVDHKRRDANGQHADFGIARRYLRMGMHLMRHSYVYLPENLRGQSSFGARREYFQMFWPYLLEKWKRYNAHEIAFAAENPLGQWREVVQNVYNITLRL